MNSHAGGAIRCARAPFPVAQDLSCAAVAQDSSVAQDLSCAAVAQASSVAQDLSCAAVARASSVAQDLSCAAVAQASSHCQEEPIRPAVPTLYTACGEDRQGPGLYQDLRGRPTEGRPPVGATGRLPRQVVRKPSVEAPSRDRKTGGDGRDQSRPYIAWRSLLCLAGITLAALLFRLLVMQAHHLYPLGGDEIGFFEQARAFVQGKGYHDLPLMRAPLYPFFLAVLFRLLGAEVLAARLAQALLSTAVVPLLYLWAGRRHGHRAGLVAAALGGAFFTLVVQSTLLLTETLFLFLVVLGLVFVEWGGGRPDRPEQDGRDPDGPDLARPAPDRPESLSYRRGRRLGQPGWLPLLAGVVLGLAVLTRSAGLPLIGLAALCYLLNPPPPPSLRRRLGPALLVLAGSCLVIAPWTVRNAIVHRALILVDTTSSVNLWLDNDPDRGRDAVKAELLQYPEGERQSLALRQGWRSILAHQDWFWKKCWREVQVFFSLEYFDDMLRRPAIWYPSWEVWARVLLGDGLYLVLLFGGLAGLWAVRTRSRLPDLLWLLYVPLSTALFHVELRYRLPFLLFLIPYAAALLADYPERMRFLQRRAGRAVGAALSVVLVGAVLLSHANYPRLSGQIAAKRVYVALGQAALRRGDLEGAAGHARAALQAYPESAEARVLLAQALQREGRMEEAVAVLEEAIAYRSGNTHPHLLLGDILRTQGRLEEAAAELAYESRSLEDLQRWAWEKMASPVPSALDLGSGLELGHVRGWHLPERTAEGVTFRWSDEQVRFRLVVPEGEGRCRLILRMSAGRPGDMPLPHVHLRAGSQEWAPFTVENGWHVYSLDVGDPPAGMVLEFLLESETFRPHQYDRYLDDNRPLGVMVDAVWLER